jgi:hypothetical protein
MLKLLSTSPKGKRLCHAPSMFLGRMVQLSLLLTRNLVSTSSPTDFASSQPRILTCSMSIQRYRISTCACSSIKRINQHETPPTCASPPHALPSSSAIPQLYDHRLDDPRLPMPRKLHQQENLSRARSESQRGELTASSLLLASSGFQ